MFVNNICEHNYIVLLYNEFVDIVYEPNKLFANVVTF